MKKERSIKDVKIDRVVSMDRKVNPKMENIIMVDESKRKNVHRMDKRQVRNNVVRGDFREEHNSNQEQYTGDRMNNIDQSQRNIKRIKKVNKVKGTKKRLIFWALLAAALFYAINFFFHSADIKIEAKKKEVVLEETIFTANKKVENNDKEVAGELYYSVDKKSFDDERTELKIAAVQEVKEYATGKVKIKNDTAKTVQLIKRTRFELDGKEYRIQNTTSIPAKSSKEVVVKADKPGADYNTQSKGKRYNIAAFKEQKKTEEYKNIYGMATTDMKGGFSGEKSVPDKDDLKDKKEKLKNKILLKIDKSISKEVKDTGDIYFKTIARKNIEFDTVIEDEKLFLVAKSSLEIPYISQNNFDEVLINKTIDDEYVRAHLENRNDFEYSFVDADNLDFEAGDNFKVRVSGKGMAIWNIDEDKLKKRAKDKDEEFFIKEVKKDFPIEKIEVSIFPFWKSALPKKIEKIDVELSK